MSSGGDKPPDVAAEEEEDANEMGEVEVDRTGAEEKNEPHKLGVDDNPTDRRKSYLAKSRKSSIRQVSVDPEPEVQLIPPRELEESLTDMEKHRFEEAHAEAEPPSLTEPVPEEEFGAEPTYVSPNEGDNQVNSARTSSSPITENNDADDSDLEAKYLLLLRHEQPDENEAITVTITPDAIPEPEPEPEPKRTSDPQPEEVEYYEPESQRKSQPEPQRQPEYYIVGEPERKSDPQPESQRHSAEQPEYYIAQEPERKSDPQPEPQRHSGQPEYYIVREHGRLSQPEPEPDPQRQSDPPEYYIVQEPERKSEPRPEPQRQSGQPDYYIVREPKRESEPGKEPEKSEYYFVREPPQGHEPAPETTPHGEVDYTDLDPQEENEPNPYDGYPITPDDIFDQLKVAHADHVDEDEGKELQSYIINKTYSSENVVVLLNIRRLPDGEWVLDKTIAQGLRPQTYGGVVSIDEYGDKDVPLCREPQPSSSRAPSEDTPTESKIVQVTESPSEVFGDNNNCLWGSIKKLEDYITVMNKELQTARRLMKSVPVPPCTEEDESGAVPPEENANEAYTKCMQVNHPVPFDDLPFVDKLTKMFNTMVYDEPCNLCDRVDGDSAESSSIGTWFKDLIGEIGDFFGSKGTPTRVTRSQASQAQSILSKSLEKLDEVQQSRLLEKLQDSGMVAIVQPDKSIDAVIELPKLSVTTVPDLSGDDLPEMDWENEAQPPEGGGGNSDVEMIKEPEVGSQDEEEEQFPVFPVEPVAPSSNSLFLVNLETESNLHTFISKHRDDDENEGEQKK